MAGNSSDVHVFCSLNDDRRNDGKQWKSACELRYNINFL